MLILANLRTRGHIFKAVEISKDADGLMHIEVKESWAHNLLKHCYKDDTMCDFALLSM